MQFTGTSQVHEICLEWGRRFLQSVDNEQLSK